MLSLKIYYTYSRLFQKKRFSTDATSSCLEKNKPYIRPSDIEQFKLFCTTKGYFVINMYSLQDKPGLRPLGFHDNKAGYETGIVC